jgi:hypothetical protein
MRKITEKLEFMNTRAVKVCTKAGIFIGQGSINSDFRANF